MYLNCVCDVRRGEWGERGGESRFTEFGVWGR